MEIINASLFKKRIDNGDEGYFKIDDEIFPIKSQIDIESIVEDDAHCNQSEAEFLIQSCSRSKILDPSFHRAHIPYIRSDELRAKIMTRNRPRKRLSYEKNRPQTFYETNFEHEHTRILRSQAKYFQKSFVSSKTPPSWKRLNSLFYKDLNGKIHARATPLSKFSLVIPPSNLFIHPIPYKYVTNAQVPQNNIPPTNCSAPINIENRTDIQTDVNFENVLNTPPAAVTSPNSKNNSKDNTSSEKFEGPLRPSLEDPKIRALYEVAKKNLEKKMGEDEDSLEQFPLHAFNFDESPIEKAIRLAKEKYSEKKRHSSGKKSSEHKAPSAATPNQPLNSSGKRKRIENGSNSSTDSFDSYFDSSPSTKKDRKDESLIETNLGKSFERAPPCPISDEVKKAAMERSLTDDFLADPFDFETRPYTLPSSRRPSTITLHAEIEENSSTIITENSSKSSENLTKTTQNDTKSTTYSTDVRTETNNNMKTGSRAEKIVNRSKIEEIKKGGGKDTNSHTKINKPEVRRVDANFKKVVYKSPGKPTYLSSPKTKKSRPKPSWNMPVNQRSFNAALNLSLNKIKNRIPQAKDKLRKNTTSVINVPKVGNKLLPPPSFNKLKDFRIPKIDRTAKKNEEERVSPIKIKIVKNGEFQVLRNETETIKKSTSFEKEKHFGNNNKGEEAYDGLSMFRNRNNQNSPISNKNENRAFDDSVFHDKFSKDTSGVFDNRAKNLENKTTMSFHGGEMSQNTSESRKIDESYKSDEEIVPKLLKSCSEIGLSSPESMSPPLSPQSTKKLKTPQHSSTPKIDGGLNADFSKESSPPPSIIDKIVSEPEEEEGQEIEESILEDEKNEEISKLSLEEEDKFLRVESEDEDVCEFSDVKTTIELKNSYLSDQEEDEDVLQITIDDDTSWLS